MKKQQWQKHHKIDRNLALRVLGAGLWDYKSEIKGTKNLALEDLDEVFKDFYIELEKKDGRNYESESLELMPMSLDRPLKEQRLQGFN